jgi:hypothetical protein
MPQRSFQVRCSQLDWRIDWATALRAGGKGAAGGRALKLNPKRPAPGAAKSTTTGSESEIGRASQNTKVVQRSRFNVQCDSETRVTAMTQEITLQGRPY